MGYRNRTNDCNKESAGDSASTRFSGSGTRQEFRLELEIPESFGDFRYDFKPALGTMQE